MKSFLVALSCLFSTGLFSQSQGVNVQIDVLNPPQETITAIVDFIGSGQTETYSVFLNEGSFSTFYFQPQINWVQGFVHIEDCNGDSLFDSFANTDSTDFHYTSFFYCESDSIFGCIDPSALNYNSFATIDDGSCVYAGPENDLCSGAQPLEQGTILIDNSFAAENEGIVGECWNFGSGEGEQTSLWYSFTTPSSPAEIIIEAISDGTNTLTDTQFGLFTECGGEMIYCDGNSGEGLLSAFNFSCGELDTNTTYILIVDGWNGDAGTCFLEYEVTNPCSQPVFGCTDPIAANYNPDATIDDGSCTYDCTEIYLWFDFLNEAPQDTSFMVWNIVNEFGEVIEEGFFDNWAQQYDFCLGDGCYSLNIHDISPDLEGIYNLYVAGGQEYFGVFNGSDEFTSVEFGVNSPDCVQPIEIEGCTDPAALNYNPLATIDDESCEYFECDNNEVNIQITTQNWGYEISWNIRNEAGEEVAGNGNYDSYSTYNEVICLEDGCYIFELFDSYGDGWNNGEYAIIVNGEDILSGTLEDGFFGQANFGVNEDGCEQAEVFGCTDPSASNYNPDATIEDGSCQYSCTNVSVGFDFTFGSPNSANYMDWTLYSESLQAPIDTGVFNSWADFVGFCLEDGCYTFVIGNIPPEWEGIYNVIAGNEFVAFGEFNGETSSIEFTFGINNDDCGGIEPVFGCTDPLAMNFNPDATIDNGSCQYNCNEITLGFDFFNGAPDDSTFYAFHWVIVNELDNVVEFGEYSYGAPQENLCLDDGCYTFYIFLISPDWNGIYNLFMANEVLAQGEFSGESESFEFTFGVNAVGCDGTNEVFGCTDTAAINYNPDATIDDGSCEYDFECGISFEVIADSTGGNMFYIIPSDNIVNASSVLWDFGDGATSSEFYPTHIYESDGPFTLCLFVIFEDDNGNYCEISYCEVLDGTSFGGPGVLSGGFMINVITPGALSDNIGEVEKEITVYPNPTNDIATISYLSDQSEKLTLRVSDLTGKVLQQRVLSSSIGQEKIQVDLSEFPQGLYLIGIEQNESRSYAKVVRR